MTDHTKPIYVDLVTPKFHWLIWKDGPCVFYCIFFTGALRRALSCLYHIFWCIGPTAVLMLFSMITHFFVLRIAFQNLDIDDSGTGFAQDGDSLDGMYHLFVLLTTANHPDVTPHATF